MVTNSVGIREMNQIEHHLVLTLTMVSKLHRFHLEKVMNYSQFLC